jgi:hypothetical protein
MTLMGRARWNGRSPRWAKAYADARSRLGAAPAEQQRLSKELTTTNLNLSLQTAQAQEFAAAAYRQGQAGGALAALTVAEPGDLLYRLTAVQMLAQQRDAALANLKAARARVAAQRQAVAKEVVTARAQAASSQVQESKLRALLEKSSGGPTGVVVAAPSAHPAPCAADGFFPAQSCDQNDPTTSGCLTARTLHMYTQARAAGFTRYTACWRQQSWGEHPKGRACDVAAAVSAFGGVDTGGDRGYGDRLAGWMIGNADRLGVLYVIWHKRIWLPGQGWHAYTTESGNPNGDHTNHVCVSTR